MRLAAVAITGAVALLLGGCGAGDGQEDPAGAGNPTSDAPAPRASDVVSEQCGLVLGNPEDSRTIDVEQLREQFGELPAPAQNASQCFSDAVDEGRPAVLHRAFLTVEGDPILEVVRVDEAGVIELTHDATHDAFGSGEVSTRTHECGWDRIRDQPAPCDG